MLGQGLGYEMNRLLKSTYFSFITIACIMDIPSTSKQGVFHG